MCLSNNIIELISIESTKRFTTTQRTQSSLSKFSHVPGRFVALNYAADESMPLNFKSQTQLQYQAYIYFQHRLDHTQPKFPSTAQQISHAKSREDPLVEQI